MPQDQLLDASGTPVGGSIVVRSVTGYSRRFPRRDTRVLVLATTVEGKPVSAGHGFPARLVAPNRRGYWWVKRVSEKFEVDDRRGGGNRRSRSTDRGHRRSGQDDRYRAHATCCYTGGSRGWR